MLSRLFAVVLLLAAPAAHAASDPKLVGTWGLGGSAELTLELRGDGTGTFAGKGVTWSSTPGVLSLSADGQTEKLQYQLKGKELVLSQNGIPTPWSKLGPPSAAKAGGTPAPAGKPGKAAAGVDGQLQQLLLSSAWCAFSYNASSGTTRNERVVFAANGTGTRSTNAETYNSGHAGTVAGQYGGGEAFHWKVQGGDLHVSADGRTFSPGNIRVNFNSNGAPIVLANGREYMRCQ